MMDLPICSTNDKPLNRTPCWRRFHSFTPVLYGQRRDIAIGVLFDRDRVFAPAILKRLQADLGDLVAENQPYSMSRTTDTLPVHGDNRVLSSVELEIRNDLIADADGIEKWSVIISTTLRDTCHQIKTTTLG